jgi:hypothetical protein
MTKNQIITQRTSAQYAIQILNRRIATDRTSPASLIADLKRELKTQKDCLEYLNSQIVEIEPKQEVKLFDLTVEAIFA